MTRFCSAALCAAAALFLLVSSARADQIGLWSGAECPNGYARANCTTFTPAADIQLDAVQAWAGCANTNCGSVVSNFNVYAADDTTLLASSDVSYLPWVYACSGSFCRNTWYFSGPNRITLHAGTTYKVRPVMPSGDVIVSTSDDTRAIRFIPPPPANPPRVLLPYRQPDDSAQTTFGHGVTMQLLGAGLSGTIRQAHMRVSGTNLQFFVCEQTSLERLADFCNDSGYWKTWFYNVSPTGTGTWDFTAAGTMARCNGVGDPANPPSACAGQVLDPAKYYAIGWYTGTDPEKTVWGSASGMAWRTASEQWTGSPAVRDIAFDLTIDPPPVSCSSRSLRRTRVLAMAAPQPLGTAIADLDGDGDNDVVSASYVSGEASSVSVFRNTSGTLAQAMSVAVGSGPEGIAVADFDGDGDLDVATANAGSGTITLLSNSGAMTFSRTDINDGGAPQLIAAGDIDGDGKPDLAISNNSTAQVRIYRNTSTAGSISFALALQQSVASYPHPIALSDLDGDGKLDVIVPIHDVDAVFVFRNTSAPGAVALAASVSYPTGDRPESVAAGDIDGDGRADLVIGGPTAITFYRNVSTTGSIALTDRGTIASGGMHVALADVDLDGRPDLLAVADSLRTYGNRSAPGAIAFTSCGTYGTGATPMWIAAGDLNGNAAPEAVVANHDDASLWVFDNATTAGAYADAGSDATVAAGTQVTLVGAAGCNTGAAPFSWRLTKPPASSAALTNASSLTPRFTADVPGFYTAELTVSCSGATARDAVQIKSLGCSGAPVAIRPVSLNAAPAQTATLTALGGSGAYTWSIVQNTSGATLSSTSGASITYTAGSASGVDIIRATSVCGSADVRITVTSQARTETLALSATPDPTNGTRNVEVLASFSRPIDAAELCVDDEFTCRTMTLGNDGRSATIRLFVRTPQESTGLDYGTHRLSARGGSGPQWGLLSKPYALTVSPGTVILLLNGYNFSSTGPHPEQWNQFAPALACQIQQHVYGRACSAAPAAGVFGTDCRAGSNVRDLVCVVDNLDGRASLDDSPQRMGNVTRVEQYIAGRPWLANVQLLLIGHSYGGQISRAYAARHPDRVKAIVTLDTPHTGVPDWKTWFAHRGEQPTTENYDEALHYFTPEGAAELNKKLGSTGAKVHAIASVKRPSVFAYLRRGPKFAFLDSAAQTVIGYDTDDIVDRSSQLGSGIEGNVFVERKPLSFPWSIAHNVGWIWVNALHNRVIEASDLWNKVYERALKPILNHYFPNQILAARDAVAAPDETPRDIRAPLQVVTTAGGRLTAASSQTSFAFDVEPTSELVVTITTGNTNPAITLTRPDATTLDAATAPFHASVSEEGTITQTFVVREPAAGEWSVTIDAARLPAIGSPWSAVVAVRSPLALTLGETASSYLTGDTLTLTADLPGATLAGTVNGAPLTFADGGTAAIPLTEAGPYEIVITAAGAYPRELRRAFTVVAAGGAIAEPFVESFTDPDQDGRVDALSWSFAVTVDAAGAYDVSADLLGASGVVIAHATALIQATQAGAHTVMLTFRGSDIYAAGLDGPYALANVRVTRRVAGDPLLIAHADRAAVSAGPYWSSLAFEPEDVPAATWLAPAAEEVTTAASTTLRWLVRDGSGSATVDVYAGETLLAGTLPVPADGRMSFLWSGVPEGMHSVSLHLRNGDRSDVVHGGAIRRIVDADADGLPDVWEAGQAVSAPLDDPDGDGLPNLDEYLEATDPHLADTDGGGESDASEARNGRDGTVAADDVATLTVTAVAPFEGDQRGGDIVRITGAAFPEHAAVTFGGVPAAAVSFLDSSQLLAVTPPHAVGVVDVAVNGALAEDAFSFLCDLIAPPAVSNSGPVCAGEPLQLFASAPEGVSVSWSGPNGFTSAERNPVLDAAAAAAGDYTATIAEGTCSTSATTNVVVHTAPSISANGPTQLCGGASVTLTASPASGALQWLRNDAELADATTASLAVTQSGAYRVRQTTPGGCTLLSAPITVTVSPASTVSISASSGVFANATQNFATVGDAGANATYSWTVTNGALIAGQGTRTIRYAAGSSGAVTLSVAVNGCPVNTNVPIVPRTGDAVLFYPITPCRMLDTRDDAPLMTEQSRTVQIAGRCGVPSTAKAAAVNLTAVGPSFIGWFTLYPAGIARPLASTMNYRPGKTRANNAVVALSASGQLIVFNSNGQGPTHFIIDVNGYFQ